MKKSVRLKYNNFQIMVATALLLLSSMSFAKPIPVETFFKEATISSPQISPDGRFFSAKVKKNGHFKLVTLNLKSLKLEGVITLRNSQDVGTSEWVNNERIIIMPAKNIGSLDKPKLTGEMLGVNYNGRKQTVLVGAKRSNTASASGTGYPFTIIDRLVNEKNFVLAQRNSRDGYGTIYKVNVNSGHNTKLMSLPGRFSNVVLDHNQLPRFAVGTDVTKDSKKDVRVIYFRKNKKSDWLLIKKYKEKESGFTPIAFTKDNKNVYVYVALGAQKDKSGIYLFDPETQKMELIWENKTFTDVSSIVWDNDINKQVPIGVKLDDGKPHYEFFDKNNPLVGIYKQLQSLFKDQFLSLTNYTDDGQEALVVVRSDKNPGSLYKFNFKTNKIKFMLSFRPDIKPEQMATMTPISYKTRDGLTIHGFLTLPKGKSKNLPLVLNVHGGPYGIRDYWGFNPEDQFLANRGYAVLQVNYRGSGGYGSKFQYSAYRQMGAQMQDDLTDATLWAIKQGIADKNRICIYGASYGGYAALMGVVKEPDLYKCAIPYAGVYDIGIQRRKSDTRQSDRGRRFLDDAWNANDQNFIEARSAYYHLDKLKAALFFVHGEDDPRVPIENYEEVRNKLKKMNYPFESMIKDREEHGFYLEKNKYELYNRMAEFLKKHIGN